MKQSLLETPEGDREEVQLAREHYCVSDADGHEDAERLAAVLSALRRTQGERRAELPAVDGVPFVRCRLSHPSQISEVVRRFLPEVESNRRLHALSFVHPLLVARELGVAVTPAVARVVRRTLARTVSFDLSSLDESGGLRGFAQTKWWPKAENGRR